MKSLSFTELLRYER